MTGFLDLRRLKAKFSSTILLPFSPLKKGAYLLSTALLIACQPSPPTSETVTAENSEAFDTPLLIRADSITMTPDHILSVKPTRYQPSLGLEGEIEPIKQVNLVAAQALTVEQVIKVRPLNQNRLPSTVFKRRQKIPLLRIQRT